MALTLIGMGMAEGDLSLAAAEKIRGAELVIVKTALNDSYAFFQKNNIETVSMDPMFAGARSFKALYRKIARKVFSLSRGKDAVYCVEGSVSEDNACKLILKNHPSARVISGVSKAASAAGKLGIFEGYTAISAYDIPSLEGARGVLAVYDLDSPMLAGAVKLKLMEWYGDECPVAVVNRDNVRKTALFELDRLSDYGWYTRAVIMPGEFLNRNAYSFTDLVHILSLLRGEGGCPWDRAQTHESIRINAVEEVYEAVDAIDRKDDERLCEELGDVLLQVVFHAALAEERGAMTLTDITTGICKKLISRHTHIFFGDKATDENQALDVWEKNKSKEHGFTPAEAVLDVPNCLPALMRAQKLQKRAVKAGRKDTTAAEAKEGAARAAERLLSCEKDEISGASGDFLFECVRLVRLLGGDAEQALADKCKSFAEEFRCD